MLLRKLDILNFKNIPDASLELSTGVNCLIGSNGMGKSNLLEAIYYLSMGRGSRSLSDNELVRHGENQMLLRGHYSDSKEADALQLDVSIGWSEGSRKRLRRDGKDCRRLSDHIGAVPVVLAEPSDLLLITGSAEERRRLMDNVISQADPAYMQHLQRYNEALKQRNAMLRQGISDPILMESVEVQLTQSASLIAETRARWCEEIAPQFASYYALIAPDSEKASLTYQPSVNSGFAPSDFAEALSQSRQRDGILGHTTTGPHRDDIALTLSGYDVRRIGSQGQMKSFTIALRLALYGYLASHSHTLPILLLDDIFDKLDADRVERIVATVTSPEMTFGQIFITDTNRKHIDSILSRVAGEYKLFNVDHGQFSLISQS